MKTLLRCLAMLLAGLCVAGAAPRPRLYIATESSPPSAMLEFGRVTGFAAEKIHVILERADIDYEMEILPWKRAMFLAQTRAATCAFSMTRTPERETMFKWVGPTHANDWTLFGLAGRKFQIATLEDARSLRIGAYNGDVRGEVLMAQGFTVDLTQERLANPRKLLIDRIDLWASSLRVGGALVAENGWTGLIVPVLTFKRTELYLACHGSVPDALIEKMNATLRVMNSEGLSEEIERKFNYAHARGASSRPARAR